MGLTRNFCLYKSTMLLPSIVVFIMLSAPTSGIRCHWCGPLAEQIHRSVRATPCLDAAAENDVISCEPGYNHCAIVATSPPHVESRYCVKLYQDECYLLFCNSSKTWKMTCPCKGDLCNGANGQREFEAFKVLSKYAARHNNARIERQAPLNSDPMETGVYSAVENNITDIVNNSNVVDEEQNIKAIKNAESSEIFDNIKRNETHVSKIPSLELANLTSAISIETTNDRIIDTKPEIATVQNNTFQEEDPSRLVSDNNQMAEEHTVRNIILPGLTNSPESTNMAKANGNIIDTVANLSNNVIVPNVNTSIPVINPDAPMANNIGETVAETVAPAIDANSFVQEKPIQITNKNEMIETQVVNNVPSTMEKKLPEDIVVPNLNTNAQVLASKAPTDINISDTVAPAIETNAFVNEKSTQITNKNEIIETQVVNNLASTMETNLPEDIIVPNLNTNTQVLASEAPTAINISDTVGEAVASAAETNAFVKDPTQITIENEMIGTQVVNHTASSMIANLPNGIIMPNVNTNIQELNSHASIAVNNAFVKEDKVVSVKPSDDLRNSDLVPGETLDSNKENINFQADQPIENNDQNTHLDHGGKMPNMSPVVHAIQNTEVSTVMTEVNSSLDKNNLESLKPTENNVTLVSEELNSSQDMQTDARIRNNDVTPQYSKNDKGMIPSTNTTQIIQVKEALNHTNTEIINRNSTAGDFKGELPSNDTTHTNPVNILRTDVRANDISPTLDSHRSNDSLAINSVDISTKLSTVASHVEIVTTPDISFISTTASSTEKNYCEHTCANFHLVLIISVVTINFISK